MTLLLQADKDGQIAALALHGAETADATAACFVILLEIENKAIFF